MARITISQALGTQAQSDIAAGGAGSGNWAHAGRKGYVGGSQSNRTVMSIRGGKDWQARQAAAKGQPSQSTVPVTTKPPWLADPDDPWGGHQFIKTKKFDEKAETLLVYDPPKPGHGAVRKPGITREQQDVFHARRDAVQAAINQHYAGGSNKSIAETIDDFVEQGYTRLKSRGKWKYISKPDDDNDEFILHSAIEVNYFQVITNTGKLKRTY